MQTLSRTPFTTVKTEGGILPADLLNRVAAGDVAGLRPTDYHLAPSERLNEAISRSWNRLLGVWRSFDDQRRALGEADRGTTLTRERWLLILLQELGYGRLSFVGKMAVPGTVGLGQETGPSGGSRGSEADTYPISHVWEQTPIHLVSFRQELDRRDPAVGRSPHSLLQEFLNRWDASLWGFASNGLRLRVLRDNASLTRAAYVEFDLEAMMAGELYSDFSLLWLVCHQSRVERKAESGERPEDEEAASLPAARSPLPADCWLEQWSHSAAEQGARALDALRDGVQEAIAALGKGFLAHKANQRLRGDLQSGRLRGYDYYRQLLRLVYRLIFLCVAEDRDLLLVPGAPTDARQRYRSYSVARLRDLAAARRGSPHPDQYRGLRLLMLQLRNGYAPLGLPGLGGFLFSERSTPHLDDADIANRDLLDALRALAFAVDNGVRRPVDYRNLDTEELGSVYESLLELHPQLNVEAALFALEVVAGSERKTTGTHYTPTPLVTNLLDTALEPVVADRLKAAEERWRQGDDRSLDALRRMREAALLSIKVIDYACGSGHMLIGAGRRLARHLARIRTGDEEPSPEAIRAAMRDVVRHCLYGVDINEMAVELCKVALWMESLEPGKPLTFLDKNIQCGNSLIGVAPGLDIAEAPDDAFQPLTGDDKKTATALRARNRRERGGQGSFLREMFAEAEETTTAELEHELAEIETLDEDDLETVALKAEAFQDYLDSPAYRRKRDEYDLWTAAFFWPIPAGDAELLPAPTQAELDKRRRYWTENDPLAQQARQIARRHGFFHWELAFPTVFGRDEGGFDVVLSNPPWERIKLQEKEWFASRSPEIAAAANAAVRKRMIEALKGEDPALHAAYLADLRAAEAESAFIRTSGKYPLCGRGDVNTYAVFAELARQVLSPAGHAGVIVPSGIATDDTTKFYFQDIMETSTLASLYDFENRRAIFPGVHRSFKFCLLTLTGSARPAEQGAQFVFFALDVADLREPERRFTLSAADIALLNPNTRTCPIFRSKRDAELTKAIYCRVPVLIKLGPVDTNLWNIRIGRMFHVSDDSYLFRTDCEASDNLRLFESKYFWQFDHRYATWSRGDVNESATALKQDPAYRNDTRHYFESTEVPEKFRDKLADWYLAYRVISNATNERTLVTAILPACGVLNSANVVFGSDARSALALQGNLNSFITDYMCRQVMGGSNLHQYMFNQQPILPPTTYAQPCLWSGHASRITHHAWLLPRVLELTYTAWDLLPFAQDVLPALGDHPYASRFAGHVPPPFRWDENRRFLLRCELDAAYFHLYGIGRDDVDYIMETFPIVKRKDLAAHGEYRTKWVILEVYDAMQQAMDTGQPYQTRLDPPPADPSVAHSVDQQRL